MNTNQVIDEINRTEWWTEEAPASIQIFYYIMKCFVNQEKIVGFPCLTKTLTIFKDGIAKEITPAKEKEDVFRLVWEKTKKDKNYLSKLLKKWKPLREKLLVMNNKAVSGAKNYKDKELIEFYKNFREVGFESVIYGVFVECVDPFTEKLPGMIKDKYKIDGKKAAEIASILSAPTEKSFMNQEKIDFIKLCLGRIKTEEYKRKYFWTDTNYKEAHEVAKEGINKRVKNEISKKSTEMLKKEMSKTENYEKELVEKKKQIINKYKIAKEYELLFSLIEEFGHAIDLRKESMIRFSYSLYHLLKEISRRTGWEMTDILAMEDSEIIDILNKKNVEKEALKKRMKCFVGYLTPKRYDTFVGDEAERIYNAYITKLMTYDLRGFVASAPVKSIKGEVCVVLDTKKQKFKEGCILVTTMTRPEFIHLTRKAKAVITDEGGITCHAAIISRELGIPCLIGTKVATRVLKNNDLIEIDLEKGIVKRVK